MKLQERKLAKKKNISAKTVVATALVLLAALFVLPLLILPVSQGEQASPSPAATGELPRDRTVVTSPPSEAGTRDMLAAVDARLAAPAGAAQG